MNKKILIFIQILSLTFIFASCIDPLDGKTCKDKEELFAYFQSYFPEETFTIKNFKINTDKLSSTLYLNCETYPEEEIIVKHEWNYIPNMTNPSRMSVPFAYEHHTTNIYSLYHQELIKEYYENFVKSIFGEDLPFKIFIKSIINESLLELDNELLNQEYFTQNIGNLKFKIYLLINLDELSEEDLNNLDLNYNAFVYDYFNYEIINNYTLETYFCNNIDIETVDLKSIENNSFEKENYNKFIKKSLY